MSGGGGGGDTKTEIRYAKYVEEAHKTFLDRIETNVALVVNDSPFTGYADIAYADAFFGAGFVISSFPSLYDMYGKFVAGLDVDVLFTQILDDSINNVAINNRVSQHAIELEDDIVQNATPRFVTGMRDINSVISSSFIVGKAMMEVARTKALSNYDAGLRHAMLPIAVSRWSTHLDWNKSTVISFAEIMKLYFSAAMDLDNHNYSMHSKDKLWPFTVLDFQRAALGPLQGESKTTTDVGGASTAQKALGGALTGAAAGAMAGRVFPGVGFVVGGVVGGVVGAASAFI